MSGQDEWQPPEGMTLLTLCAVPGCEKIAGHEDEHGLVVFDFERTLINANKDRWL